MNANIQKAFPTGIAKRGFERGVSQEDLIIPRVKLLQALSPEVQENDMKQGTIINSLTKEILPSEFIPIFVFKNFVRFNPRNAEHPNYNPEFEPGAIVWRSNDSEDARVRVETKFGPNGEAPAAITFLNFFSYFPGVDMPLILSFAKTSYKAGKQLFSMAKFSGDDMYKRKYLLSALKESNDIGTYFVYKVAALGNASDESTKIASAWWEEYAAETIQVHDETPEEEVLRPY